MVARLDPVKGHKDFLEAAALLKLQYPEAQFVFAGGEANLRISDLKNQSRKLGLGDSCSFLGWRTDVCDIMRSCHIGVISSVGSEAVSRAALEWMAAGRPVVATRIGCLPELVRDGVTGRLVEPGKPDQMAEALIKLAKDQELRLRKGQAAWERARREFGIEQLVSATLRVYRESLSNLP
jgi:glycosyltransferase involved in cell wall biosynthesis